MSDVCDERLKSCTKRMDSQAGDISKLFDILDTRITWRTFFWTLSIFFTLLIGSYGYTKTVADDMAEVVTKQDMQQYQNSIIEAIKEIK